MSFYLQQTSFAPHTLKGLFVGVEHFPSPTVENLDFCTDDAIRQCQGFGCDPEASLLVEEHATRVNILERLFDLIDQSQKDDILIFSITRHGVIAYNDYFFTPYEADAQNILGTCISATQIVKTLATAAERGSKVLMIIDSCHSGAITFDMSKYKGGISCLFSCSPMELSLEAFLEGRKGLGISHDRGGNGLFTNYLAEALEKQQEALQEWKSFQQKLADSREMVDKDSLEYAMGADKPDPLTLRSLYEYVYDKVAVASKRKQHPLLIGTLASDLPLI